MADEEDAAAVIATATGVSKVAAADLQAPAAVVMVRLPCDTPGCNFQTAQGGTMTDAVLHLSSQIAARLLQWAAQVDRRWLLSMLDCGRGPRSTLTQANRPGASWQQVGVLQVCHTPL